MATHSPVETLPKDGRLLRLLVDFEAHNLDDDVAPHWTIGHNNFDNTGEDEFQFAGWCWSQDHFTQGVGKVVGWLPYDAALPGGDSRRVDELLTANNTYLQRARDAEAHVAELKAALTAHEDITESCGICRHPFVEGVLTLQDVNMGEVHAACCGPERDCYVDLETGEPLGPDDPIPTGRPWVPDAVLRRPSDAEKELRTLYRAYVNLLETGRDRIVANGGTCDAVDRMEEGDPALIRVRQFLAEPVPPEWTGQGTDADFFEKPEPKA